MALNVMLFPGLKSKPLTPSRYSMSEQLREGVRTRARSIIVHNSNNSIVVVLLVMMVIIMMVIIMTITMIMMMMILIITKIEIFILLL